MYLDHFGLSQAPFKLSPDPGYLYLSSQHRLGLSLLRYGLSEAGGGLTVITGAVGAGKTTLLRKLLQEIDYDHLTVGIINNTLNFDEHLIHWVASAFELSYEGKEGIVVFREFQQYLIQQYSRGKQTILIVDEAQNLREESLEELRLLTNINAEHDQLLKIILVGQPELLAMLTKPKLAQIAQRVSVEYHLDTLSREETANYIRHRMQVAGASVDVFDESSLAAVYALSAGVPRLINTLCDQALVFGFAMEKNHIDIHAILEVCKGRRIGGLNHHDRNKAAVIETQRWIKENYEIDLMQELRGPEAFAAEEAAPSPVNLVPVGN